MRYIDAVLFAPATHGAVAQADFVPIIRRMEPFDSHPIRDAAIAELHARPFPTISGACDVAFLAYKFPSNVVARDRLLDLECLNNLVGTLGLPRMNNFRGHYYQSDDDLQLKWESHTEFVTFTLIKTRSPKAKPIQDPFALFPEDWLKTLPGRVVTTATVMVVEATGTQASQIQKQKDAFYSESLVVTSVLEGSAMIATDFRRGEAGHSRFHILLDKNTGPQRTGRIVQRVLEIESYKNMAFLALPSARSLGVQLSQIERDLTALVARIKQDTNSADAVLDQLLDISGELEGLIAHHDYRFSAARAYAQLVEHRVSVLREHQVAMMQTINEFLTRRFAPAMRTVEANDRRLQSLAARAGRAAELLRTRVEVGRSQQNQDLLRSMDKRANLQLRLQKTVEGLSVVAISYYAVNLLAGLLAPLNGFWGIPKYWIVSAITVPVIFAIWFIVNRIRKAHSEEETQA